MNNNPEKQTYFIIDREYSSIVARLFVDDIAKMAGGRIIEFIVAGTVVANVDTRDGYSVAKLEDSHNGHTDHETH